MAGIGTPFDLTARTWNRISSYHRRIQATFFTVVGYQTTLPVRVRMPLRLRQSAIFGRIHRQIAPLRSKIEQQRKDSDVVCFGYPTQTVLGDVDVPLNLLLCDVSNEGILLYVLTERAQFDFQVVDVVPPPAPLFLRRY